MPPVGLIVLILLIALPLLEIAVLIKAGSMIGVWATLAIVVSTFILGLYVIRLQGAGVARRMFAASRSGEPPVAAMFEVMLLMFAGGCLMAPGLITDAIGLLLLIPPLRQRVAAWVATSGFPMMVEIRTRRRAPQPGPHSDGRPRTGGAPPTIDGDYERVDEKEMKPPAGPPADPGGRASGPKTS